MLDVAHHLGVGWDMVKDIQKRHLQRHYAKPKLKEVKHIAIDEISVGKGFRFVTVVLDLDSGAVVFVGEGKGADALDPFWRRLNGAHATVPELSEPGMTARSPPDRWKAPTPRSS